MKIQNTADLSVNGKFRFMVYGASGIGKTRLLSTIPDKVLIMNTDKGMLSVSNKSLDYVSVNSWKEVVDFLEEIKSSEEIKKKYKWLAFDSVSAMMDLLFNHLGEVKNLSGYDLWREYGKFVLKFMRFLRDQEQYHTVSIFEMLSTEDSNGVISKSFAVQGEVGKRIPGFFDEVFALRSDKDGKRFLQTNDLAGFPAKDRSQTLTLKEEADLALIMNKIIGGTKV